MAEYNALRSEIQYRSEFQSRLLEIHIAALTAILGAAVSKALSLWVILLIPIESSIIGLWYLDHALMIQEIGSYIRTSIQRRAAELLNEPHILWWETAYRVGVATAPTKRVITFRRLLFFTFGGPPLIALAVATAFLILSVPQISDAFQIPTVLGLGPQWWLVFMSWIIGISFFFLYWLHVRYLSKISAILTAESEQSIKENKNTEEKSQQ